MRDIKYIRITTFLCFVILSQDIKTDNFYTNSYNNHGVLGLINTPSARTYEESNFGATYFSGEDDKKITLTSNPFDWLEASFFYTNLENLRYCGVESDPVCAQDSKDKGFNVKFKVRDEDRFPAIAIGINDIAGTGYYSSEYIVGSYGINRIDLHFGLGWGTLNGSDNTINNPFSYVHNSFNNRPTNIVGEGGQFQPSRYFSSNSVSPFYGLAYKLNKKTLLKFERDTTLTPGRVIYDIPKSKYSYGLEYDVNDNFTLGLASERGNYITFKVIYKQNPKKTVSYKYKKANFSQSDNKFSKLIKNLENNGVGVNKIVEYSDKLGIELTQFKHSNLQLVEEIVASAAFDSGIDKEIIKDYRIADLKVTDEIDLTQESSQIIYERKKGKSFETKNKLVFRPFLAAREGFFKGAYLVENDSQYIFKDNLIFNSNIKYALYSNFDDLVIPPADVYPAQVRSDIKDYLRQIDNGVVIGRAQLDYYKTFSKNNHVMFTAGILEDMFNGWGGEYLYYKNNSNYAIGFEVFKVYKRDYAMRHKMLDYQNIIGSLNLYYRNYNYIPFDMKLSFGEYLAGDIGGTIEFSRSFKNGTQFGVFASFTDVSAEQFGEGSFDKGIFFNIPIYGNFINYTWKPLTKDPGAKLNRKNSLHDLLIKFKPLQ